MIDCGLVVGYTWALRWFDVNTGCLLICFGGYCYFLIGLLMDLFCVVVYFVVVVCGLWFLIAWIWLIVL